MCTRSRCFLGVRVGLRGFLCKGTFEDSGSEMSFDEGEGEDGEKQAN